MKLFYIIFTFILTSEAHSQIPDKPIPKCADITVNGVYLYDSLSVINILGRDILKPKDDITGTHFYNKEKSEILSLIFHPGNSWLCFSEFKLFNATKNINDSITTIERITHFITGKGIHLGISRDSLIILLGKRYKSYKENEAEIIKYSVNNMNKSPFLQFYNMPVYYGKYVFVNKILSECEFGFEYP